MRVLVTGANGQLGAVICGRMRAGGHDVLGLDLPDFDVTDHGVVMRCASDFRPEVIVNCAAFTDVDGAEDRALLALEVNAFAVRSLARAAAEHDAVLVHYSTDFVFEGEPARTVPYTEEDRPNPQSFYGVSKLLGEWFAAAARSCYVLRLESLFGGLPPRSGIDRIIEALSVGRESRLFADRVVSPSYVEDVANATESALTRGIPFGLYHCVNEGATTWLELGHEIARLGGFDASLLVPVKVADVTLKAKRPQYCALSGAKLVAADVAMPTWQDAVGRYFRKVTAR
jgi:dTDP-4-dehydrorhamnose reductase